MISKEHIRKIGTFTKPHGIKGEIGFIGIHKLPEAGDNRFVVCEVEGINIPFFIEGIRSKTQTVQLVKFAAVDSEESARRLSGKDVYVPAGSYPQAEEEEDDSWDSVYGYKLEDQEGNELGAIVDIDASTLNVLLAVDNGDRRLLVPAVEDWIIDIDHEGQRLQISLPEGLLDI